MSGNGELKPEEPNINKEQEKPKDIVLTITLHQETGALQVQGPGNGQMFDEPMCFWLLYKAQRFIEAINAKNSQSRIVTPQSRMRDIFPKFKR